MPTRFRHILKWIKRLQVGLSNAFFLVKTAPILSWQSWPYLRQFVWQNRPKLDVLARSERAKARHKGSKYFQLVTWWAVLSQEKRSFRTPLSILFCLVAKKILILRRLVRFSDIKFGSSFFFLLILPVQTEVEHASCRKAPLPKGRQTI